MRWFSGSLCCLLACPVCALDGYVVGAGIEADSQDGLAASIWTDLGLTEKTWLSVAFAKSTVDSPRGRSIDTLFADIAVDHWFEPIGVQLGMAYWGDSDVLDSTDVVGALYWRNAKTRVALDAEYRDYSLEFFRQDALPGQDIEFHSTGVGLSARFSLSPSVDLSLSGMKYDYNVNLGRAANLPITDFLSVSRLSLINSLIEQRVKIGLSLDAGEQRWSLDYANWKGEVDGSRTNSTTLRLLTPMGQKSDIEFGIGVDDSDTYGSVTFFSVFVFFYG